MLCDLLRICQENETFSRLSISICNFSASGILTLFGRTAALCLLRTRQDSLHCAQGILDRVTKDPFLFFAAHSLTESMSMFYRYIAQSASRWFRMRRLQPRTLSLEDKWSILRSIVSHGISEGLRRGKSVITRVDVELRNDFQLFPLRFTLRDLPDQSDHFSNTLSLFLSWYISPELDVVILRPSARSPTRSFGSCLSCETCTFPAFSLELAARQYYQDATRDQRHLALDG